MKAYMFPGQGSQRKGMGESLFDEFPELTRKADEALGYSIKELCLQDPEQKLNQTQYTQPALYTVNALSYLKKIQGGERPDYLAGHSLGEYNALQAAGAFSFETGLALVRKRGELMAHAKPGAMAAVINCPETRIRGILAEWNLENVDIANLNAPNQIIISGLKEDVAKSQEYFEKVDAKFIPLNTSGAFHSRFMRESATEFGHFAQGFEFAAPAVPVVANVTARPYESGNILQNLIEQIASPVRWTDSVLFLLDQGVMAFEELGVGDVLTKLVANIKRSRKPSAPADSSAPASTPAPAPAEAPSAPAEPAASGTRELVDVWNRKYPVGTRVTSELYDGELRTRTEALILFGHRAAIYIDGYNGYFDLRELKPVA
ncbi:MAG TPA: ACP S-malonyltransferase [Fibrobacteria bacterium]|nr:ACP S-malonyltransferase [Fibrobacteria bacterium]